jgi:hypothetical protein
MAKPPQIHRVGEAQPYMNILLTAESGWGKTPFAGTAGARGLIASVDPEGTDSAFFAGSESDEWLIRSKADWDALLVYMRKEGCSAYEWLTIDSITELQKMLLKHQLSARPVRGKQEALVADRPDYQITQLQLVDYVKEVNDLPINVLWTAPAQELETADGESRYYPAIHGQGGNLAKEVRGYMKINMAGQMIEDEETAEGRVRRAHFIQTGPYMGRDRTGALGDFQDDLTIPKLEALVKKHRLGLASKAPAKSAGAKVVAGTAARRPVKRTAS